MDLNALRMFVLAADAGSLSAASRRARIPLPTLSRRVRALEAELGARLVERGARGLTLTDAGRRLHESAARGLELLVDAERRTRDAHVRLAGLLRVSIPPDLEPWWSLLALFQQAQPLVDVRIFASERRVDLVADGIDVALRIGSPADASYVARLVTAYRHVLVASPALLARADRIDEPSQLSRIPCGAWGHSAEREANWTLGPQTVTFSPRVISNQYAQLRALALMGACAVELPPYMAREPIARGELVELLPRHPLPERKIHLVFPSRRYVSSLTRAYVDFCIERGPAHLHGTPSPIRTSTPLRGRGRRPSRSR